MCVNQHDPSHTTTRPDGRRVCEKCASKYHRRIRVRGLSSTTESSHKLVDHALEAAEHGIPVLPVRGKRPLTKNGHLDASLDPGQIQAWWEQYPNANIGGRPPLGYVVLDVDRRNGGETTFEFLGTSLPETRQTTTGNGFHLWYSGLEWFDGQKLSGLGPGVDLKRNTGYVLMPGSRHHTGFVYTGNDAPVSWAGDALIRLLEPKLVEPYEPGPRNPDFKLPAEWLARARVGGGDRSALQAALVHVVLRAGGNEDDWLTIVTDPWLGISQRYADKAQKHGNDAAMAELRTIWNSVSVQHEKPRKLSPSEFFQRWLSAAPAARASGTDRQWSSTMAVLWALAELAYEFATPAPIASVRTLATRTGMSSQTVATTLSRLTGGSVIHRVRRSDTNYVDAAYAYELCCTTWYRLTYSLGGKIGGEVGGLPEDERPPPYLSPGSVTWRGSARGHRAWLLYIGVQGGGRSTDALAEYAGVSVRTAEKILGVLAEEDGLVFQGSEGWRITGTLPSDLHFPDAEVAAKNQAARVELQRIGFAEYRGSAA